MYLDEKVVKEAFALYYKASKKGYIQKKNDKDLYNSFLDPKIKEAYKKVIQPISMSVLIQVGEVIYLVPKMSSMGFSNPNEEFRNLINLNEKILKEYDWHTL